jgi:hypothetical protein
VESNVRSTEEGIMVCSVGGNVMGVDITSIFGFNRKPEIRCTGVSATLNCVLKRDIC